MENSLPENPEYNKTMRALERLRHTSSGGSEYWFAREIQAILGYEEWRNFTHVISRAEDALRTNELDPSHHIVETNKKVEIGSDAIRERQDYFLSRAACYLIAINGDPSKPQIAAAQAYFVTEARKTEIANSLSEDEKRLELREKVTESFKAVSGAAHGAGVTGKKQGIFHDARYRGLYNMSRREMMGTKGLGTKDNPFDRMGALELSANDFQMNLAAETIEKERVRGENAAIAKNREIAQRVRKTMIDSGSEAPENLPPAEPIKEVRKRIRMKPKTKNLPSA